jgi:ferredoxin
VAYVVTEPCVGCKYTDCVVVCPCDCFHEGEQMLFIDPDECVDCDACKVECPVDAIFHEDDVPEVWKEFIPLNREMAATCPPILDRKEPLARRGPES